MQKRGMENAPFCSSPIQELPTARLSERYTHAAGECSISESQRDRHALIYFCSSLVVRTYLCFLAAWAGSLNSIIRSTALALPPFLGQRAVSIADAGVRAFCWKGSSIALQARFSNVYGQCTFVQFLPSGLCWAGYGLGSDCYVESLSSLLFDIHCMGSALLILQSV